MLALDLNIGIVILPLSLPLSLTLHLLSSDKCHLSHSHSLSQPPSLSSHLSLPPEIYTGPFTERTHKDPQTPDPRANTVGRDGTGRNNLGVCVSLSRISKREKTWLFLLYEDQNRWISLNEIEIICILSIRSASRAFSVPRNVRSVHFFPLNLN